MMRKRSNCANVVPLQWLLSVFCAQHIIGGNMSCKVPTDAQQCHCICKMRKCTVVGNLCGYTNRPQRPGLSVVLCTSIEIPTLLEQQWRCTLSDCSNSLGCLHFFSLQHQLFMVRTHAPLFQYDLKDVAN